MHTVPSFIERLPDIALPAVQRAYDLIAAKRATQRAALERLNVELAAIGLGPVSRPGFNRWAARISNGGLRRPEPLPSSSYFPKGRNSTGTVVASPETINLLAEAVSGVFRYFHGDGFQIDHRRIDLFERCVASMRRDLEAGKAA